MMKFTMSVKKPTTCWLNRQERKNKMKTKTKVGIAIAAVLSAVGMLGLLINRNSHQTY